MPWERAGHIFASDGNADWMVSHAAFPTPLLCGDVLRLYFSCRNRQGKSLMTFVDVDPDDPRRIVRLHDRPLLELGEPGTFDDSGTQPNCVVRNGGQVWLYYLGWNLGVTTTSSNNTGLAISDDDGVSFRRAFRAPVLDRTLEEPFYAHTPSVLREADLWRCWYGSGVGWVSVGDRMEGVFEIKYAESRDGIHWIRPNLTCIASDGPNYVCCKPSVLRDGDCYRMWFSYRSAVDFRAGGGAYRIGYAESGDGRTWTLNDDVGGLGPSGAGWDSHMVCYCSVIDVGSRRLMFYTGDGFGAAGFGFAVWRD